MEFTAQAPGVRRALDQARRALSANPPLAAYTGVLLQATGGHLLASGSDGETTVTSKLAVQVVAEGSVLVVPGPLSTYLDRCGDGDVHVRLTAEGDLAVSVGERDPYLFRPLGATFPAPTLDRAGLSAAELGELGDALSRVRHAAEGVVQLRSDDSDLVLVSTDRYRIAQVTLPGAGFGTFSGVVPVSSIEHLARETVAEVGIDARGRVLRARGPEVFVSTRLVDEPFPDVGPIVDAQCPHQVTVDCGDLVDALERLHAVAAKRPVSLSFAQGTLTMRATNVELGSGEEALAYQGSAESFSCHLNATYLREAAAAHRSGPVRLCWSGPRQAIHLRSDNGCQVRTVLMPVEA